MSLDPKDPLEIAQGLIRAGMPIFASPPCEPGCGIETHPVNVPHFKLPTHWQRTYPSMVNLDKWRPGWALSLVCGARAGADVLDVDPRAGGDAEAAGLRAAGLWPRTYGRQATPSGGEHYLIAPTGERKITLRPGLDLQAGASDGRGLGFVYIAPTVAAHKLTGELHPYSWSEPPDLEALTEARSHGDTTTSVIIDMVRSLRSKSSTPTTRSVDPDDPFATSSTTGVIGERAFTLAEAMGYVRPCLENLQKAQIGHIEESANIAATTLSHFIPGFWTVDEGMRLLAAAISHTAYDPNHPASRWTIEKFRAVLDGRRPPLDPWVAIRRPDPPSLPASVTGEPAQTGADVLNALRAQLINGADFAAQKPPKPLIHGLLDMDTESWIIGAPGSFKSFIALDIAAHVGAGKDWQGLRTVQNAVLYVAAEGVRGMVLRVRAWQNVYGEMLGVHFLPVPVLVKSANGQWDALVALAKELNPGLVVIDTQARVSVGLEENSATDMGVLTAAIGALRRATGACVLVVHHTGRHGDHARGSSALDGAQDSELRVVRASPRSSLRARVLQDKQKDMAEDDGGIEVQMLYVDLGIDPETDRKLGSLVVARELDPFATAADGAGEDVRVVRPWLPEFGTRDVWRRKILNGLYDFAPVGRGITKPELRTLIGAPPKSSAFAAAWKALLEQVDQDGEPVVIRCGGQRYDIGSLPVLAALEDELGPRGDPNASESDGGQG